jgi:hypothetical protein
MLFSADIIFRFCELHPDDAKEIVSGWLSGANKGTHIKASCLIKNNIVARIPSFGDHEILLSQDKNEIEECNQKYLYVYIMCVLQQHHPYNQKLL